MVALPASLQFTQEGDPLQPRLGGIYDRTRRIVKRNPVAAAAVLVLVLVGVLCFGAPWFTAYNPNSPNLGAILQPPSATHLMGTSPVGEDVFAQVLYGGRVSLLVGLMSAAVAVLLGGIIGVVSGYFGGWIDALLMRIVDAALAIPVLFIALTLSVVIGQTPMTIILIVAVTSWMLPARLMRASVLDIKTRLFVEAAASTGATWLRIVTKHVVP